MKKLLSLLSTISLSTIISTNIIACNIPNTNDENNKPIEPEFITQQPPTNSNWKLIDDFWEEQKQSSDGKWYIGIYYKYGKTDNDKYWVINKFNNITKIKTNYFYEVYRWDGNNEPLIPTINENNGEITNWNEKIETDFVNI